MNKMTPPSAAPVRPRLQHLPQPVRLSDPFDGATGQARGRRALASDLGGSLAPSDEPVPTGGLVSLDGVHVMVVEDNADARNIIRRVLEHCGAIVTVTESATPALRRLRSMVSRPNVLVSDLALPGDDGYWLIGQVRAVERLRALPAIAITAHRNEYDREATLAAGFQEYFQKPLDLVTFSRAVARLAGR